MSSIFRRRKQHQQQQQQHHMKVENRSTLQKNKSMAPAADHVYTNVATADNDVESGDSNDEGGSNNFPSSFHSKDSAGGTLTSKGRKTGALFNPNSYNARRKMICGFVSMLFICAGLFISYEISKNRGHIGGAGSFLGPSGTSGGGGSTSTGANAIPDPTVVSNAQKGMSSMVSSNKKLDITTWNIAAINNNPFEYWITIDNNPQYEELMINVEKFLDGPTDQTDILVNQVFTQEMFDNLNDKMTKIGWASMKSYWDDDYSKRKIITQFMKDPTLGSKRLASMPDRITNTINVDGSAEPVCRPTVINMYEGDLSTLEKWYAEWIRFMFETPLKIKQKDNSIEQLIPYQMLQPIKKSKYPDITPEEELDSLPLQTLCGAIFDSILVHMMNTVSSPDIWQPIKRTMVQELNRMKVPHTLQILESTYITSDIITMQEVSSAFIDQARSSSLLSDTFHIISPLELDVTRDQNSIILLKKETFPGGASSEITSQIESSFPEGVDVPVAKGDILGITTTNSDHVPMVIVSFHGDTNGLATKPVLDAIIKTMSSSSELTSYKLIFGLDANTYDPANIDKPGKKQNVMEWGQHYVTYGLSSCWGDVPQPTNYTTYNARTYLQPQLNKACKSTEKRLKGDVNPKDFILFNKEDWNVIRTIKDNTGEKTYIEDMAFPTLKFPSDHGLLSTTLQPKV